jgi:hypothetical protein
VGLYNFQKRFEPFILDGRKTHTIRATRSNPDKPGNTLHLYTGLRQKGARLLMRVPCVKLEEIEIKDGAFGDENHASISIDGHKLARDEREALARRDGFESAEEMIQFWRGRLPFKGHIIHWNRSDVCECSAKNRAVCEKLIESRPSYCQLGRAS